MAVDPSPKLRGRGGAASAFNPPLQTYTHGCAGGTVIPVNHAFDAAKTHGVAGTDLVRAAEGFDRVRGAPPGDDAGSLHAARHPLQTRSASAAPKAG
jgi:hypothetical protein